MSDPEHIDPRDLRPGPIRHESLPPELLDQAAAVYDVVGPYLGTTLEQFEINLMRDADPESEVAVWLSSAAAWLTYHEKHTGDDLLPDEDEKKLLAALIVISTGAPDVNEFGVRADVGRRLLGRYDGLASG